MTQQRKQAEPLKLISFLGNPGSRYASTRHNAAWIVLDHLEQAGYPGFAATAGAWKEKFHGHFLRAGQVVLLRPTTHMNESGRSVQAAMGFFGFSGHEVLVLHDDLETPFGTTRLVFGGGHRGNNGVRSVAQRCGGPGFWRLRIGIGRPPATRRPSDWVLERFSSEEEARIPELCDAVTKIIVAAINRPQESERRIL